MEHDDTLLLLTRIETWPELGGRFLIWFDDPEYPDALEQWRESSTVQAVEPWGLPMDSLVPADE